MPIKNTVPKEIWLGTFVGPTIRKVECISRVFSSSVGEGARITVLVGVVAGVSVGPGGDAGIMAAVPRSVVRPEFRHTQSPK
jgi:hypothetical protein